MFRSRLFGFVAVTLCLLAFVSAHGEGNTARDARKEVNAAKKLTNEVLMNLQGKYRTAEDIKGKVESRKIRTESAANDAQKAAGNNKEAAPFVEKAKTAVAQYLKLYPSAQEAAAKAFDTAEEMWTKARQLDYKAQHTIVPNSGSAEEYTQLINNATEVKNEAEKLKNEITVAQGLIATANSKLWALEAPVKDAQVAKYQVDAIVKVVEIENMLNKAEADIKSIEQNKNEANATVEAIYELFKNISNEEVLRYYGFRSNAERDLGSITDNVNEVKEAQNEILKHKENADKTIEEIKQQTEEETAERKLQNIMTHTSNAATALEKITRALDSSGIHVKNTNNRKQGLLNALAQSRSNQNSKNSKPAENSQRPAEDGRTKQTKNGTEQTVENNPTQSLQSMPTKPVTQGSGQTVEDNQEEPVKHEQIYQANHGTGKTGDNEPEQSVSNEPTQPTKQNTEQTRENNKEQPVQSEPTQAVTQGTGQTVENHQKQSVNNAPIKPSDKETDRPVEKSPKQSVNNEPTKPAISDTKQTVQNKPKQSVKDKIKEVVNNEVLSTSDVINDNAITATFLLPLTIILFASLHGRY